MRRSKLNQSHVSTLVQSELLTQVEVIQVVEPCAAHVGWMMISSGCEIANCVRNLLGVGIEIVIDLGVSRLGRVCGHRIWECRNRKIPVA